MTKKTRTTLFVGSVFLFLIISAVSVSYSQGYRFDFEKRKIVQTGGIFLKVKPARSDVFIDEKPKGKTNFLSGKLLIKNLMPRPHKIRVEKPGFFPWEKNLKVEEKKVTEAKNILLIPKNPKLKPLIKGIKNFKPLPEKQGLILFEENKKQRTLYFPNSISGPTTTATTSVASTTSQSPSLLSQKINNDLYHLDKQGHIFKNNEKLTTGTFDNFRVSPDKKKIILWTKHEIYLLFLTPKTTYQGKKYETLFLTRFSKELGQIFWLTPDYIIFRAGKDIKISETDTRDHLNIVQLIRFPKGETKIFFEPTNKNLYILNQETLFVVNIPY